MKGWVTVKQFADEFDMTRQGVVDRIRRDSIKARMFSNKWMIPKKELKAFEKMEFGTREYLVRVA